MSSQVAENLILSKSDRDFSNYLKDNDKSKIRKK
jgi:hypothetical protein